jgi:AraC-like DNA-binding protein
MMASDSSHAILQLLVDMQDWVGCFLRLRIDRPPQRLSILVDTKFDDPELLPFLVDEALCRIARTVVFIAGPESAPTGMELTIPCPPHWESYKRLMGCPVSFGQPQNRLDFASVPVPVPTADATIEAGMRELLFQEMKVTRSSDLLAAVLNAIRRDPAHIPSLKEIAASMNIGERTLRRRLSSEGVSYAGLLAAERREHALTLVRTSAESMTKIAADTGFSDSRSLRRAIKRWTGNKPTNFRRQSNQQ